MTPGEKVPLKGVQVQAVTSNGEVIAKAITRRKGQSAMRRRAAKAAGPD